MTIDNIKFERTLEEVILEDGKYSTENILGLTELTLERFNCKIVKNPENEKIMLVHYFGNKNYYNISRSSLRYEKDLKLFGSNLVSKKNNEIYICDDVLDAIILNQELGLDAVAIFKSKDEIINSYSLLDNKEVYFISSTNIFDNIKTEFSLSKCITVKFDTSIKEHFKRHGDIRIVNEYLWGAKSPTGIKTANMKNILSGSLISERSLGYSTGFKNLDRLTQGFSCDMIGIGAGTGCGKSTLMTQFAATLIGQGVKVGMMFFEQADERETILNLIGHFDSINYNYLFGTSNADFDFNYEFEEISELNMDVEDDVVKLTPFQVEKLENDYAKPALRKYKDLMEVMTNDNDSPSVEDALSMIRSLVIQKGCKAIFLDHTTYLTDGVENQNKAAQILMQGLMQIKNRHMVNIFYVTHLRKSKTTGTHEEGARVTLDDFAGGKAGTQYATVVLGLERDMNNDDVALAEITKMRLLKRRGMSVKPGDSVSEMKFDIDTNKLYPVNCRKPISAWSNGIDF